MLLCPIKVSKPSLKLRIFWMNCRTEGQSWEIMNPCIKLAKMWVFCSCNILERYPKLPSMSLCVCATTKNLNCTSSNIFHDAINKKEMQTSDNYCYFNIVVHLEGQAFRQRLCSNKVFLFKTHRLPNFTMYTKDVRDLGSLCPNSLEYWAKVSPPCPWVIIPINVMGN